MKWFLPVVVILVVIQGCAEYKSQVSAPDLGETCEALAGPCRVEAATPWGMVFSEYTYDGDGRVLTEAFGDSDMGVMISYSYEYDQAGLLQVRFFDSDGDGLADSQTRFSYDENDWLIQEEASHIATGRLDEWIFYIRDDHGTLTRQEWDFAANGSVDMWSDLTYDEAGYLILEDQTRQGYQRDTRTCTRYVRDAAGNPVSIGTDENCDGNIETSIERSYDANGFLVLEEHFRGEAQFYFYFEFTCDACGNILQVTEVTFHEGQAEERPSSFDYSCWN
jgi:hypothetical protein